ncbi:hypothetical protein AGMMS49579_09260 [Spirochaetia bacterium]|nr:hypothetical protein AGMMS49579_09260 [Spirochaetia bacterium]
MKKKDITEMAKTNKNEVTNDTESWNALLNETLHLEGAVVNRDALLKSVFSG